MTGSPTDGSGSYDRRSVLAAGAATIGTAAAGALSSAKPARAQDGLVAETKSGRVRGTTSPSNNKVFVFEGIPYAADAGGANRFMPPQPVTPWSGIRDAAAYGARSPGAEYPPILIAEEGVDLDQGPVSEDSLFLNVWTGALNDGGRRPVMVWFHGGGFTSGSGGSVRYDGTNLAARRDWCWSR